MEAEQSTWRNLFSTGGFVVLAIGGQPLVNYISGDSSLRSAWPSLFTCAVGLGLILVGFFYHPKPEKRLFQLFQIFERWAVSPIPYVLMLLSLWIYFETLAIQQNLEISALRNDQHSITDTLDRFVLPRQLTSTQIGTISSFLQNFPPQEVSFDVVQGDEEASSYKANIQTALERGGWHTKPANSIPEPQSGLSIEYMQTTEHQKIPSDWKHPSPALILEEAFGLAGVRAGEPSVGSGINITEDSLKIIVGHRRRDSYALPIPREK